MNFSKKRIFSAVVAIILCFLGISLSCTNLEAASLQRPLHAVRIKDSPQANIESQNQTLNTRPVIADFHQNDTHHWTYYLQSCHFAGRLGNLMFHYASLLGIANATGMTPYINASKLKAQEFQDIFELTPGVIVVPQVHKKRNTTEKFLKERSPTAFSSYLMQRRERHIWLYGFLQSYKYFDHIKHKIRREFMFKKDIQEKAKASLKHTLGLLAGNVGHEEDMTLIGVHARRSDVTRKKAIEYGYNTPEEDYYHQAMDYFRRKYPDAVFVIASDDREWAAAHVQRNRTDAVLIADDNPPPVDMATLSFCNHSIISIGTYGWWAAWLAGGDTVYFSKTSIPNSTMSKRFSAADFYLPEWVGIP